MEGLNYVAMNSRMNSWTLMKTLVVPCLLLCAIFKHPAFQWIACVALVIWVSHACGCDPTASEEAGEGSHTNCKRDREGCHAGAGECGDG